MPPAIRKAKLSFWVDYPTDWQNYGWSQQNGGHVRLVPSARQISLYDEALNMVFKMEQEDRKLVWAVAHSAAYRDRGVQWTKIARMLSLNDPRIVRRRYKDALVKLYYKQ